VREITALVLAERAKRGVKVRQPLAKLAVGGKTKLNGELRELLASEVNVKVVEFNPELKTPVEIDWNITPELKEEGIIREIIRQIQELRKSARLTPADKIAVYAQAGGELGETMVKNQAMIAKETKAAGLKFKRPAKVAAQAEVGVGGQNSLAGR